MTSVPFRSQSLKRLHVAAVLIFATIGFLATPSHANQDIEMSTELAQSHLEAAEFHQNQLLNYYLPELNHARRIRGLQTLAYGSIFSPAVPYLVSLGWVGAVASAAIPGTTAVFLGVDFRAFSAADIEQLEDHLKFDQVLSEALTEEELALYLQTLKTMECHPDYRLNEHCAFPAVLEDLDDYIHEFSTLSLMAIEAVESSITANPRISLEVNNFWQHMDKPTRYTMYYRYMSVKTILEIIRNRGLWMLYSYRAELLDPKD